MFLVMGWICTYIWMFACNLQHSSVLFPTSKLYLYALLMLAKSKNLFPKNICGGVSRLLIHWLKPFYYCRHVQESLNIFSLCLNVSISVEFSWSQFCFRKDWASCQRSTQRCFSFKRKRTPGDMTVVIVLNETRQISRICTCVKRAMFFEWYSPAGFLDCCMRAVL